MSVTDVTPPKDRPDLEALKKRAKLREKALKKKLKRRQIVKLTASHVAGRKRKNAAFTFMCASGLWANVLFLVALVASLCYSGAGAFTSVYVQAPVSAEYPDAYGALAQAVGAPKGRLGGRDMRALLSNAAPSEFDAAKKEGEASAWLRASSSLALFVSDEKRQAHLLSPSQTQYVKKLQDAGTIKRRFNADFWKNGDSNYPELAGILAGLVGVCGVALVCMAAAFPCGVMTAVYLEEFASRSRFSSMIEINVNNLAAIPSVIFGLLGLSLYIGYLGAPRSSILAGALTLVMMALPVVVIASRAALRSVPQSVRDGALALGATRMQTVLHHVLPAAAPGMATGAILGLARIIGETAPLLLIGMVAFIMHPPANLLEPATTLPVQIYMWSDRPESGFREKTAAAIVVLLGALFALNLGANLVRKRYST
ncbi:MAG: phosphate ABC transporter permease PstA [Rickettsiales bacterium]